MKHEVARLTFDEDVSALAGATLVGDVVAQREDPDVGHVVSLHDSTASAPCGLEPDRDTVVQTFNGLQQAELDDFLFGAFRISHAPVTAGLRERASARCFYCAGAVAHGGQIDHFVPWTRHIDNGIENLVYAHGTCNNAKSAYLAAEDHVDRRVERMIDSAMIEQLQELADSEHWDSHAQQTLAVARSIYLKLPDGYKLWAAGKQFTRLSPVRLRSVLSAT